MNNINILSILPIADPGEAAPGSQRGSRFDNQWTPHAVAVLRQLAADGKTTPQMVAAMAAEFGATMTREAVRGKGVRLGIIARSQKRKIQDPKIAPPTGNGWSQENMTLLRALVAKGLCAAEIGAQIVNAKGEAMTKNAVHRKAHRMKLNLAGMVQRKPPVRVAPGRLPAKATAMKVAKPPKPAPAPRLTMREVLANAQGLPVAPRHDGTPVGLMDLAHDGCRWPLGNPLAPDFGYCGNRQHVGTTKQSPYCRAHHVRAYGGGTESEKSAHRVSA